MLSRLSSSEPGGFKESPGGHAPPPSLHYLRNPSDSHPLTIYILIPYAKRHPVTPAGDSEHDGKVSIGGRNITNLLFADDTDALAEEKQELEALNESLDKTCTRYQMEIRAEKTKLMTKSANGIHRKIKVKSRSWTL